MLLGTSTAPRRRAGGPNGAGAAVVESCSRWIPAAARPCCIASLGGQRTDVIPWGGWFRTKREIYTALRCSVAFPTMEQCSKWTPTVTRPYCIALVGVRRTAHLLA